ncbi:hypothetical protein GCM10010387_49890 [Streptomyces inusitatus]|uniref:Uncharacterized protein n=1 Tax=Streptomyces inusitatus TaxID=68221 RepID=A0A918QJA8_9ACTN|nr:hypothetical protein [Streptomyces inusitatus]GGZ49643.1 hypothetical protein GCM10010387_49890 [Streptomyces inusitatus]
MITPATTGTARAMRSPPPTRSWNRRQQQPGLPPPGAHPGGAGLEFPFPARGTLADAIGWFTELHDAGTADGDMTGTGRAAFGIGLCHRHGGRPQQATAHLFEAQRLWERKGASSRSAPGSRRSPAGRR